jgi:hypothetical protein
MYARPSLAGMWMMSPTQGGHGSAQRSFAFDQPLHDPDAIDPRQHPPTEWEHPYGQLQVVLPHCRLRTAADRDPSAVRSREKPVALVEVAPLAAPRQPRPRDPQAHRLGRPSNWCTAKSGPSDS